jgi:hypothetical protein
MGNLEIMKRGDIQSTSACFPIPSFAAKLTRKRQRENSDFRRNGNRSLGVQPQPYQARRTSPSPTSSPPY